MTASKPPAAGVELFRGSLARRFAVWAGFDTEVTGAALAEGH